MADHNLTGLKGFGEGDPKPEFTKDQKRGFSKRVARGTMGVHEVRKQAKDAMATNMVKAKSKALSKKSGSADGIDRERKRQGYKPLDAKTRRIHEGMDKYLP